MGPREQASVCSVQGTRRSAWLEVVGSMSRSGSGDMKGKGKAVVMSPRASKKKKCIKKSAVKVVDSNIEVIARPSDAFGSGSGHVLLEHMDCLILAVENLAEAQWYTASACLASGMVVGTLMDKCNFLRFEGVGLGEEDKEVDMDMEVVDQEAVKQEVTELWKEVLGPQPSDDEM